jgi:hypothetical protein
MVLIRVLTVECLLASEAGLLEGRLGGSGGRSGFGGEDFFIEDFLGYWRQRGNTALHVI